MHEDAQICKKEALFRECQRPAVGQQHRDVAVGQVLVFGFDYVGNFLYRIVHIELNAVSCVSICAISFVTSK